MSKYASLTAGILARKGEAEPTATPFADQLLTRVGCPAPEIEGLTPMHGHVHVHAESAHSKLQGLKPPPAKALDPMAAFGSFGRSNAGDAGKCETRSQSSPALAVVASHEDDADAHCVACPGPSPEDAGKTYHVNLRLKRMRFIKLKLSAALLRRPVQDVVAEALDQWFDALPPDVLGDCMCLKARGD
jgi:hypothetical protein